MARRVTPGGKTPWSATDWVALAVLGVGAALGRLWHLGSPSKVIFDETYYAKDACWYAYSSAKRCGISEEQTSVHPPLGKWLISLGVKAAGYDSFGWRVAAVAAGVLSVIAVFILARKLLGTTWQAVLAAALMAIDPLHFVQSRVAMLDIFVVMLGLAAFLFLAFDRDRTTGATGDPLRGEPLVARLRLWRLAAGLAAGAAVASKWSGVLWLAAIVWLTLVWELAKRREEGVKHPARRALAAEGWTILAWLVLAPMAVYALSYAGRLDGVVAAAPWSDGSFWRALFDRQLFMYEFHSGLESTHSFQSPPWSWFLLKRPVSYYFDTTPSGDYREIIALGSPVVWWASLVALLYVAWSWLRARSWRGPKGMILAGFSWAYLPWLVLAGARSAVFLFYALPSVPFMCLALAWVAGGVRRLRGGRTAIAVASVAAAALFAFYWPLLTGAPISQGAWHQRLWVFDDAEGCAKPPAEPTTTLVTETHDGTPVTRTETTKSDASLPPVGWCWV
ncbi:phospholipid carrier-dependent glycosyltransferase [soil metagenome]